jgi:hypothetical protein
MDSAPAREAWGATRGAVHEEAGAEWSTKTVVTPREEGVASAAPFLLRHSNMGKSRSKRFAL